MSSRVSCMSAASWRISGAVGSATREATCESTGLPIFAMRSTAMLSPRPGPALRPREAAARRRLAEAVHHEDRCGRRFAVYRELRVARRDEGAVDAERPVHRAGRHGEDEGLHQVPPAEDDFIL